MRASASCIQNEATILICSSFSNSCATTSVRTPSVVSSSSSGEQHILAGDLLTRSGRGEHRGQFLGGIKVLSGDTIIDDEDVVEREAGCAVLLECGEHIGFVTMKNS